VLAYWDPMPMDSEESGDAGMRIASTNGR
jgi:hypothetical protein